MQTITKADSRGRVVLRGAQEGHRYLVTRTAEGWYVTPETAPRRPKPLREWAGPKKDLAEHLQAMFDAGLELNPLKQEVWPCRF